MNAVHAGPAASLYFFSFALTLILSLFLHGFHTWHSLGKPLLRAKDRLLKVYTAHSCDRVAQVATCTFIYCIHFSISPTAGGLTVPLCAYPSVSRFFLATFRPSECCCRMLFSDSKYDSDYCFHGDEIQNNWKELHPHATPQHRLADIKIQVQLNETLFGGIFSKPLQNSIFISNKSGSPVTFDLLSSS